MLMQKSRQAIAENRPDLNKQHDAITLLLPLAPLTLLVFFAMTTAASAYTCHSMIGNLDCSRGSGRKDILSDGRAKDDPSFISGHHPHREYPWCSVGSGSHHRNCGFASLEQCLQTVRGVGGVCNKNPAYRAHSAHH